MNEWPLEMMQFIYRPKRFISVDTAMNYEPKFPGEAVYVMGVEPLGDHYNIFNELVNRGLDTIGCQIVSNVNHAIDYEPYMMTLGQRDMIYDRGYNMVYPNLMEPRRALWRVDGTQICGQQLKIHERVVFRYLLSRILDSKLHLQVEGSHEYRFAEQHVDTSINLLIRNIIIASSSSLTMFFNPNQINININFQAFGNPIAFSIDHNSARKFVRHPLGGI